ncbi:hypothetical protein JOC70_003631 [Clostridium pascui]|nr:hypothetical protein [Clostridium pascui]
MFIICAHPPALSTCLIASRSLNPCMFKIEELIIPISLGTYPNTVRSASLRVKEELTLSK